jgi:DNA-binding transcriptional regulator YhcF (GntR family)
MISPLPGAAIYHQIAARIREKILSGEYAPGQPIPSERSIAQEYGVARETAKRAHHVLRAEALIIAPRGQSWVVREQPPMQDLTPPAGATVTARATTVEERAELDLPEGVPLLVVTAGDGTVRVYPADRWRLRFSGS